MGKLLAQGTEQVAAALQTSADGVTCFLGKGVGQRLDDQVFLRRYESLDVALVGGRK